MLIGAATIADVIRDNGLTPEQFFSKSRKQPIVEARRQAILRLKGCGFRHRQIANLVQCSYDGVRYWLNGSYREKVRARNLARSAITQPWKNKARADRARTADEKFRSAFVAGLDRAGFVAGRVPRRGRVTAEQLVRIISMHKRKQCLEAKKLACSLGLHLDYPSAVCSDLKISRKAVRTVHDMKNAQLARPDREHVHT